MNAPPFTYAGIRLGFYRAQPMALSVLVYGIMFGVLAASNALSSLEALLMSVLIYSGSAQMAALQGWATGGAAVLPLVITILILNARYLLYGAALRPWLGGLDPWRAYGTLFLLGDGNWALAMKEKEAGRDDAGFLLGSGLIMFVAWTTGTLTGHLVGGLVTRPELFGIDFLLAAFSAALMMGLFCGRRDLLPSALAALVAFLLVPFVSTGWVIVAAGLIAAATGYFTYDLFA